MLIRRTTGLVALVAAAASACSTAPPSQVDLAQGAESLLREDLDIDSLSVNCPSESDSDEDPESLRCVATIAGQTAPVQATLEDGVVVEARLEAIVVDSGELENSVGGEATEVLGQQSTASCGDSSVVVIQTGEPAECEVTAEDGTTGTAVIAVGPDGEPVVVELRADD